MSSTSENPIESPAHESDDADAKRRAWRIRIFSATWLSYFGYYFCRKPFFIVKHQLNTEYGIDLPTLGLMGASYLAAYAIGQFIAGWAGTRFGPRKVLLWGMGVSIVCNVAFGLAAAPVTFGLFLIVLGFAQATGWSNNVGTMANWTTRSERGTVMGMWATNFQLGSAAAGIFAGYAASRWGVPGAFYAGTSVLIVVWIYFFFNHRNHPSDVGLAPIADQEGGQEAPDEPWSRDLMINIGLIGSFYFFAKFIRYALDSWAPLMAQANLGMDVDGAAYWSQLFGIGGAFGALACGVLSDYVFKGKRAFVSFLFVIGMTACCGFLYTYGMQSNYLFGLSMAMMGFSLYGPDALMSGAAAMDVGSAKKAVVAAAVINGMGSFGAVAQDLIIGSMIEDGGPDAVFKLLVASSVAGGFCLVLLLIRNATGKADM